eukprot:g2576.t1
MTSKETLNHSRAALKAAKAGPAKEKVATVLDAGALGAAKDARQAKKAEKELRAAEKKKKEDLEAAKMARKAKKSGGADDDPLGLGSLTKAKGKKKKGGKK